MWFVLFGLVWIWIWCLWVWGCSRPACISPFHPIAKTMLFNAIHSFSPYLHWQPSSSMIKTVKMSVHNLGLHAPQGWVWRELARNFWMVQIAQLASWKLSQFIMHQAQLQCRSLGIKQLEGSVHEKLNPMNIWLVHILKLIATWFHLKLLPIHN